MPTVTAPASANEALADPRTAKAAEVIVAALGRQQFDRMCREGHQQARKIARAEMGRLNSRQRRHLRRALERAARERATDDQHLDLLMSIAAKASTHAGSMTARKRREAKRLAAKREFEGIMQPETPGKRQARSKLRWGDRLTASAPDGNAVLVFWQDDNGNRHLVDCLPG